jgi:hypothetical protein
MVATEGHFDVLGSEIWEIAISQCRCTLDGHFLRGGIDIGLWYYDKAKDLLVSPAMVKAYKDERDRACYPVIAISDQLYRLLRDHPLRKVYSKDIDPFPDQFSSFKHLKSGKRVRFIKYLRLVAPSLDWQYDKATRDAYMALPRDSDERDRIMTDGYVRNLVDFFERHKAVITSAYGAAKDDVKEKYRFLAKYHNSELRRFLSKRGASASAFEQPELLRARSMSQTAIFRQTAKKPGTARVWNQRLFHTSRIPSSRLSPTHPERLPTWFKVAAWEEAFAQCCVLQIHN